MLTRKGFLKRIAAVVGAGSVAASMADSKSVDAGSSPAQPAKFSYEKGGETYAKIIAPHDVERGGFVYLERDYETGRHLSVTGVDSADPRHWHDPNIIETDGGFYPPLPPDAEFIAAARADIPWLLELVKRLKGEPFRMMP